MQRMETVYIGIGSNKGDSRKNCQEAVRLLARQPKIYIESISNWYFTEPFGPVEQEWFVNGAVCISTRLNPEALLKCCQDIETAFNRQKTVRWGPRTIDLDILVWEKRVMYSRYLVIPHPWMHRRRFVLKPLNDLAPQLRHPLFGKTVAALLDELQDNLKVLTTDELLEFSL